jgi:K+-sensing histidine kinase KdpD
VAQIASAHGGTVSVENAADGGAVFTLSLLGLVDAAASARERPCQRDGTDGSTTDSPG